jgi:aspartate/methionine/tyrosine aminotransferase
VLAVSPNNPTGSFLDDRDMAAVASVCARHGLALIGDEVFADYSFLSGERRSPSVLGVTGVLAFGLGGLSKAAGLPQLKLGWIAVAGPGDMASAALTRLEVICDSYLSVGTPIQQGAGALLARAGATRDQIAARVRGNYERLHAIAAGHPSASVLRAEGGWYAVVQVPAVRSEEDLVLALLEQDDVVVYPGYFFDFAREAFFVVSLLPQPDVFEQAIGRVLRRAA